MTRLVSAALLLAFALGVDAAEQRPLTIRDVAGFERVSDPQASPDGRYVAYVLRTTDFEADKGVRSIWLLDTRTGRSRKLTGGTGNSESPRWSSDGGTLYFLSTRSGSSQVWRLPFPGGEAQAVTQLPLDVTSFAVSPKNDRVAITLEVFIDCPNVACSKRRLDERAKVKGSGRLYDQLFLRHWDTWKDGRRSQLFVAGLKLGGGTGEPMLVSRDIDGDVPSKPFGDDADYCFTPDGESLIFSARVVGRTEAWSTNFDLWIAPANGSAKPRNLTADNPAWDAQPLVTPDGRTLVYLAMKRAGFEADRFRIMRKDLETGKTREIAPKWDRSPDRIRLSENGSTLYATADDLGDKPLFAIKLSGGAVKRLTAAGTVSGFTQAGGGLVLAHNRFDKPDDLYRIAWNGGLSQLTQHNADKLSRITMAPYERFSFAGWNEEKVHGYVMKPAGFAEGHRYPVAFIIHGGPQTSMGNNFHYRWNPQVFSGMGYAVVFIDYHGSSGYGQAFTDSISGDWGGKPLEDLQRGLAQAVKQYPWLDGDRVCALGASYGGYMINWIAGNWPDRFRCLVNHDGVFDNRSMGYSTEELWFDEWEMGGTPFDEPEKYERHNPVNHVARWKTPMLVIHSQNDFRVPLEQGIAAFTALQRRGIESRFLYFPDENHWVLKPNNSIQWYDTVQAWLDRWLKPNDDKESQR